eukprot:3447571-Prymnesium_polylepis.1
MFECTPRRTRLQSSRVKRDRDGVARFSRPLERVVHARRREMMPFRFPDDLPRRQQRKRLQRLCKRRC